MNSHQLVIYVLTVVAFVVVMLAMPFTLPWWGWVAYVYITLGFAGMWAVES